MHKTNRFTGLEIIKDGETGLLISPKNPTAISEALEKLIENAEERKRLGEALKEKVEQDFSLDKMVRETVALYT